MGNSNQVEHGDRRQEQQEQRNDDIPVRHTKLIIVKIITLLYDR